MAYENRSTISATVLLAIERVGELRAASACGTAQRIILGELNRGTEATMKRLLPSSNQLFKDWLQLCPRCCLFGGVLRFEYGQLFVDI